MVPTMLSATTIWCLISSAIFGRSLEACGSLLKLDIVRSLRRQSSANTTKLGIADLMRLSEQAVQYIRSENTVKTVVYIQERYSNPCVMSSARRAAGRLLSLTPAIVISFVSLSFFLDATGGVVGAPPRSRSTRRTGNVHGAFVGVMSAARRTTRGSSCTRAVHVASIQRSRQRRSADITVLRVDGFWTGAARREGRLVSREGRLVSRDSSPRMRGSEFWDHVHEPVSHRKRNRHNPNDFLLWRTFNVYVVRLVVSRSSIGVRVATTPHPRLLGWTLSNWKLGVVCVADWRATAGSDRVRVRDIDTYGAPFFAVDVSHSKPRGRRSAGGRVAMSGALLRGARGSFSEALFSGSSPPKREERPSRPKTQASSGRCPAWCRRWCRPLAA